MQRLLAVFGLGSVGALLGFVGAHAYIPPASSDHLAMAMYQAANPEQTAQACVPVGDTEDIFYISCGGIY